MDPSFPECSPLQVEDIMELLDICLTTTYFQFDDKFYQQKEGMAMGNSLLLVVSNLFIENSEEAALDTADHKPTKWLRYVDDTSWFGHMDQQDCSNFFISNSISPTTKFTMTVEADDTLLFLNVLVMKRGPKSAMKVFWKFTHTGHYLHFKSNHPHGMERGVVHSLISQAKVIWQNQKDFNKEIKNTRHDPMLNQYPQEFIDSLMKPQRSNRPSSDTICQGTVIITCQTQCKLSQHQDHLQN
jgi:hypothetical protein